MDEYSSAAEYDNMEKGTDRKVKRLRKRDYLIKAVDSLRGSKFFFKSNAPVGGGGILCLQC